MNGEKVTFESEEMEEKDFGRKNFITHLKYLRKRSALTLENLSQLTGISVSYLSRLESGARRLNTDLIKRLSQALDCDPAELLQDTVHDENQLITTSEIRKIRTLNFAREKNKRESRTELKFDLPMYEVTVSEDGKYMVDLDQKAGFRHRPFELAEEKDAICMIATNGFDANFPNGANLFLVKKQSYNPEATVVVVTKDNVAMLKKIWSVTPNGIQCCDPDKLDKLKNNDFVAVNGSNVLSIDSAASYLVDIKMSDVRAVYQVVGYMSL